MPERARLQPLRKRRFAAEGLTLQKIFAAVLLGATLGLLASVVRVASQSRFKGAPEPSRNEAVTSWQTSQQVAPALKLQRLAETIFLFLHHSIKQLSAVDHS